MGHSTSRHNACAAGEPPSPLPSRFARFRRHLRLRHRDHSGADASESGRAISAEEFAGIARIRIVKVRSALRPSISRVRVWVGLRIGGFDLVLVLSRLIWLVPQAEMGFKDKFFACLSLGERTYRTETSDKLRFFPSYPFSLFLCLFEFRVHR